MTVAGKKRELSRSFLGDLLQESPEGIITLDRNNKVTSWNRQAEHIFGWSEPELLGQNFPEEIFTENAADFFSRANKKPVKLTDVRLRNKSGEEFPVEIVLLRLGKGDEEQACAFIRNIDEEQRSKEALQKSEARYRSLIDQASDAIMITDRFGNFVDVNIALCKMFGYSREELLKSNISMLIDPEQLATDPILFDKILAGLAVLRERRMMTRNKTIIEVEANVKALPDGRVLAIARDITERKRAQQQILREKNLSDSIINSLPGVFFLQDNQGKYLRWNTEFETESGYKASEIANMNTLDFFDEKDRPAIREKIAQVFSRGYAEVEAQAILSGERRVPFFFKAQLIQYEGKPCLIGSGINISERKKAEEERSRLVSIIENTSDLAAITHMDSELIFMNRAGRKMLGIRDDEDLSGTSIRQYLPEWAVRLVRGTGIPYAIKHGTWSGETALLTRHGTEIPVLQVMIVNKDERGEPIYLSTIARDFTERKETEQRLMVSEEKLRKLSSHLEIIREEERTNIAREIHDELGQQLTGLKMDASFLSKKIPATDKATRERIAGMMTLIDDTVKTVQRISSELRPGILDDLGLIDAIDWQSQEFQKRTGTSCIFTTSLSEMKFDRDLATGIFRIYQETLTNVARHARASSIQTRLEFGSNELLFTVEDNGTGFHEKEIRNKNTLGLLGMKERAMMFGGKLTIDSRIGKGTTIAVQVPYFEGARKNTEHI